MPLKVQLEYRLEFLMEDLASRIDPRLLQENGRVFYSGRAAFGAADGLYVLGFNPGGSPDDHVGQTVAAHTSFVLGEAPHEWSAYADESWLGRPSGGAPLQRRVAHLLKDATGEDPRRVASSNLIFTRSKRIATLGADVGTLVELCWPVHDAVLERLRPRAVVCLGLETAQWVRDKVAAHVQVGLFRERNSREWESRAWRNDSGLVVFGLTHPSIADWTKPETNPGVMVREVLAG